MIIMDEGDEARRVSSLESQDLEVKVFKKQNPNPQLELDVSDEVLDEEIQDDKSSTLEADRIIQIKKSGAELMNQVASTRTNKAIKTPVRTNLRNQRNLMLVFNTHIMTSTNQNFHNKSKL